MAASPAIPLEAIPDASPREAEIGLAELAPGASAVVVGVDGDAALAGRLLDLGFVPETPVRAVRRAPLGDPTEYELRGYRVCLRRAEGARIRVRPA